MTVTTLSSLLLTVTAENVSDVANQIVALASPSASSSSSSAVLLQHVANAVQFASLMTRQSLGTDAEGKPLSPFATLLRLITQQLATTAPAAVESASSSIDSESLPSASSSSSTAVAEDANRPRVPHFEFLRWSLRGIVARSPDPSTELPLLFRTLTQCGLSEAFLASTIGKWKARKFALLCKSIVPIDPRQDPWTAMSLLTLFLDFMRGAPLKKGSSAVATTTTTTTTEGITTNLAKSEGEDGDTSSKEVPIAVGNEQATEDSVGRTNYVHQILSDKSAQQHHVHSYQMALTQSISEGQLHASLVSRLLLTAVYVHALDHDAAEFERDEKHSAVGVPASVSAWFVPLGWILHDHLWPLHARLMPDTLLTFTPYVPMMDEKTAQDYRTLQSRLAARLLANELVGLRAAIGMTFTAGREQVPPHSAFASSLRLPAVLERAEQFTRDRDQFAKGIKAELDMSSLNSMSLNARPAMGGRNASSSTAAAADAIPMQGQKQGTRFFVMKVHHAPPSWDDFLAVSRSKEAIAAATARPTAPTTTTTTSSTTARGPSAIAAKLPPSHRTQKPAAAPVTVTASAAVAPSSNVAEALLDSAHVETITFCRTAPLQLLRELLRLRQYNTAAALIRELREDFLIDIFGYRGPDVPHTASKLIMLHCRSLVQVLMGQVRVTEPSILQLYELHDQAPLLIAAGTQLAYLPFVQFLCGWIETAITTIRMLERGREDEIDQPTWKEQLLVREQGLTRLQDTVHELMAKVLLPCLRVLPPSDFLQQRIHEIMLFLGRDRIDEAFCEVVSKAPRSASDLYSFKELEATFSHAIKRVTLGSIALHRRQLQRVLYAEPMFVAEKLFQQAIGYENAQVQSHAMLLQGAPASVLTMFLLSGLRTIRQFALEEAKGYENRIWVIAVVLATVWRLNPDRFDSYRWLSFVDSALDRPCRSSVVIATSCLRAMLWEFQNAVCEGDEQYSADQLDAMGLTSASATARWFARGSSASFLTQRCHPLLYTPSMLDKARNVVRDSLSTAHSSTYPAATTIGTSIVLKLCASHAMVDKWNSDLPGTIEQTLATTASDYNTLNDLIWLLVESLTEIPSEEAVRSVALPHITARMKVLQQREILAKVQATPTPTMNPARSLRSPSTLGTAVGAVGSPFAELAERQQVEAGEQTTLDFDSFCNDFYAINAWHLRVPDRVYALAKKEAQRFVEYLSNSPLAAAMDPVEKKASMEWAEAQIKRIQEEQASHVTGRRDAWDELALPGGLLDEFIELCHRRPMDLVRECLLRRALTTFEDTIGVTTFLSAALTRCLSFADLTLRETNAQAVINVCLHLVTSVMSLWLSFHDTECKRAGVLLSRVLALLHENPLTILATSSTPTTTSALLTSEVAVRDVAAEEGGNNHNDDAGAMSSSSSPSSLGAQLLRTSRAVLESNARRRIASSGVPSYLLDVDAYLAGAFVQLLRSPDTPQFLIRHTFLLLERLKGIFPFTAEAAQCVVFAVRGHAHKESKSFAAATATLKTVQSLVGKVNSTSASYMQRSLQWELEEMMRSEADGGAILADPTESNAAAVLDERNEEGVDRTAAVLPDEELLLLQEEEQERVVNTAEGDEEGDGGGGGEENDAVAPVRSREESTERSPAEEEGAQMSTTANDGEAEHREMGAHSQEGEEPVVVEVNDRKRPREDDDGESKDVE